MLGGTYLFPGESVFYSTHFMSSFYHLQAAIFFVGVCDGDHYREHLVGKQEFIFIPVSIILVPFPGPANLWLFLHQFAVKMANSTFAIEKFIGGVYHAMALC